MGDKKGGMRHSHTINHNHSPIKPDYTIIELFSSIFLTFINHLFKIYRRLLETIEIYRRLLETIGDY
jgi:hypothetical protein